MHIGFVFRVDSDIVDHAVDLKEKAILILVQNAFDRHFYALRVGRDGCDTKT
jgi:hypothetical protein